MENFQHNLRKKVVHFIIRGTIYGSLLLGLLPFRQYRKQQKLQRAPWLLVYGLVLNVSLIIYSMRSPRHEHTMQTELFRRNALSRQINNLHEIFRMIMMLTAIVMNFVKSKKLVKLLNELQHLEHKYFVQLYESNKDCCDFDWYIIYKAAFLILQLLSTIYSVFGMVLESTWTLWLSTFIFCILQLFVLLMAMHHYLSVLYVYRYIWLINEELTQIANAVNAENAEVDFNLLIPERLHRLLYLYKRVLRLNAGFSNIYEYQLTLLHITILTANIVSIFYYIVYTLSVCLLDNLSALFMFSQIIIINIWDFWLDIAVCERAQRAGVVTKEILKRFHDTAFLDQRLECSVNTFALFCSHQRLCFRFCDLFHVNNETGFKMMVTTILYLLFLVQHDYVQLHKIS